MNTTLVAPNSLSTIFSMNPYILSSTQQNEKIVVKSSPITVPNKATTITTSVSIIDSIAQKIDSIEIPIDYPPIDPLAIEKVKKIYSFIAHDYYYLPIRIAPFIEGGIAIVYRTNIKKLLKKIIKEIFIEVYNDGSFIISLLNNFDIMKIKEVEQHDDFSIPLHEYFEKNSFKKIT